MYPAEFEMVPCHAKFMRSMEEDGRRRLTHAKLEYVGYMRSRHAMVDWCMIFMTTSYVRFLAPKHNDDVGETCEGIDKGNVVDKEIKNGNTLFYNS